MNAAVQILQAVWVASVFLSVAFAAGGIEKSTDKDYVKLRNAIKNGEYTPASLKNMKLCADDSLVGNYILTIGANKDLFVDKCSIAANKTYEKGIFRPSEGKVNGAPAFVLKIKNWKDAINANDTKLEDVVQAISFVTQEASRASILQTEGATLFVDLKGMGVLGSDKDTVAVVQTAFESFGRVLFPFAFSNIYIVNAKKLVKLIVQYASPVLEKCFGCKPILTSVRYLPAEIIGILPKPIIDKKYDGKETEKWDMKLMNALMTGKRDGDPINYNNYWKA